MEQTDIDIAFAKWHTDQCCDECDRLCKHKEWERTAWKAAIEWYKQQAGDHQ